MRRSAREDIAHGERFEAWICAFPGAVLIVFCDDSLKVGAATRKILGKAADALPQAAAGEHFTGKSGASLDIVLPADLKVSRLTVIGAGKIDGFKSKDFLKLGGAAAGKLPGAGGNVMVVADLP